MTTALIPFRANALAELASLQRRGYVTRLSYVSRPGEFETWECGWMIEYWRHRDDRD